MITTRARSGFDQLVQAGLRTGLAATGAGPCVIEPLDELGRIKDRKIVVLTVSSYLFRLITVIYFRPDAATRAFFAGAAAQGAEAALDEKTFLDRVAECGNNCCGSLNRDLGRYFPHVGMSTPNIIDKDCMRYVDLLGSGYLRHYRIRVGAELALHASLCVTDYGDVDFAVEAQPQEDVSTGELELL